MLRSPSNSLEQAVEYCFNYPTRPVIEQQNSMSLVEPVSSATTSSESTAPVVEPMPETADSKIDPDPIEEEGIQQLDKTILDKFANTMLPGLMKILYNVPDTVYRVCELIVVVVRKYGETWRDNSLTCTSQ